MFIYKITVDEKDYIGFDSKPEYKQHRWKTHCRIVKYSKKLPKTKLYNTMKRHGVENCTYEVLESGFKNLVELALAEIKYINQFNSYKKGLNSTPGGDGLGKHVLSSMSEQEINLLKETLGEHWSDYNKKKWSALTPEERKEETSHLHTPEIYERKSATLKKFYAANPDKKKDKGKAIKKWQEKNKETLKENNKKNGLKGAEKVSKEVVVEWENGKGERFKSRREFERQTGLWFSTLVEKSKRGEYYKGYRLRKVDE
jgi:hypothetical protein